MKMRVNFRVLQILIPMLLILSCGRYGSAEPPAMDFLYDVHLFPPADVKSLACRNVDCNEGDFEIVLDVVASYPQWVEWADENNQLLEYMDRQFPLTYDDELLYPTYVFTTISDISITANQELWGRQAGTELKDLFWIDQEYNYLYPSADMFHESTSLSVVEWLSKGYMAPRDIKLSAIKPPTEVYYGDLAYTITIGLGDCLEWSVVIGQW